MNGISVVGETHKEVVSLLKELPIHVSLVCCHPVPPPNPTQMEEDEEERSLQLSLKELLQEFNEMVCLPSVALAVRYDSSANSQE